MQGVLRGLILGIIPVSFSGCYAGTAALVLGILALSEDGGSKGGPHAASLKIHESPEGTGLGRAADLASVEISFDLIGVRLEDAADFTLEFARFEDSSGSGEILWKAVAIAESPRIQLESGEPHVEVSWDARAQGCAGLSRIKLRVAPGSAYERRNGAETEDWAYIGNTPPLISSIAIVSAEPRDAGEIPAAVQNVVVRYVLENDVMGNASDVAHIELQAFLPSGNGPVRIPPEHIIAGETDQLLPGPHDLVWDSLETFGTEDIDELRFGIRPTECPGCLDSPAQCGGAPADAPSGQAEKCFPECEGALACSAPFALLNDTPAQAIVVEPSSNPDASGAVQVRFQLIDVDEGETALADVVLQWARSQEAFLEAEFNLADLEDGSFRRSVIADPQARSQYHMLTPRLRTLIEGRCHLRSWLAPDEVILTETWPPAAVSQGLVGATLELLSDGGGIQEASTIREVVQADSLRRLPRRLKLERAFTSYPRQGQRARVKESPQMLLLGLQPSPEGSEHEMSWDAPIDVGVGEAGARYYIRATAFSGKRRGASFTSSIGKSLATDGLYFPPSGGRLTTVRKPEHVGAADLRGTGRMDVIVASCQDVSLFLGNGDGTFEALSPFEGKSCSSAVADFNDDGHPDLVTVDRNLNQLSVFLGAGNGSFPAVRAVTSGLEPWAAAAADLDGDSRFDVVSADSDGDPGPQGLSQLSIFWGRGDGTFVANSSADQPRTGLRPFAVAAADLDGDARADLASSDDDNPRQLRVFYGQGGRKFLPGAQFPLEGQVPSLAVAEINGDGLLDLIAASRDSNHLLAFLGAGGRSFAVPPIVLSTGAYPNSVIACDVNRDGVADLASADGFGHSLSLFLGKGDGTFARFFHPALEAVKSPVSVAAVDLDGDGVQDLAAADESGILVLSSGEAGGFGAGTSWKLGGNEQPSTVIPADLNGDRRTDLVISGLGSSRLLIFKGQGDGSFDASSSVSLATGKPPRSAAVADLNDDGILDLASVGWSDRPAQDGAISVFLGQPGGALGFLGLPERPLAGARPAAVAAADWGGDGIADLILADQNAGEISIFIGKGDGTFQSEEVALAAPGVPQALRVADLDGDGRVDLMCATESRTVAVLLGGGTGGKPRRVDTYPVDGPPKAMVAEDLSGDGRRDLVVAVSKQERPHLQLFLGKADGFLEQWQALGLPEKALPLWAAAADIDADGRPDVLASCDFTPNPSSIVVFHAEGDGTFRQASARLETGLGPRSFAAADLSGDGDLDLVSADYHGDQLSVFLNLSRDPRSGQFFADACARGFTYGQPAFGPAAFGNTRAGIGRTPLVLGPGAHTINTSTGTIDGQADPSAFRGRAFWFPSIHIQEGATLLATGAHPLYLFSQGDVVIEGKLLASGAPAQDAAATPGRSSGTAGGRGGPGGASGGDGGGAHPGGGALHGLRGGGGGGGAGGFPPADLGFEAGFSGGGGGHGTQGADSEKGGMGGSAYGNPRLDPLAGGSGGGGGSVSEGTFGPLGRLDSGDPAGKGGDSGGGGGGGGGGAVCISSGGDMKIHGEIRADGGSGARGSGGLGGGGGGGSGGAILLRARGQISISQGGLLSAAGGEGASSAASPNAGSGGEGRIRFEDSDGRLESQGSIRPPSQEANVAGL